VFWLGIHPHTPQVSDGIIAPSYEPRALEILAAKKGGAFIVLQANADFTPPDVEYREVGGVVFAQRRNDRQLSAGDFANAVTQRKVRAFAFGFALHFHCFRVAMRSMVIIVAKKICFNESLSSPHSALHHT
jgi:AICAR transformylase/IMP cyclohydrolase PurH